MKVFFQFFTNFFRLKNTLVARDYFTTSHISVDPLPYALNYGLLKVILASGTSMYIGGKIAHAAANLLEENEIFVHSEEDDDDD